MLVNAIRIPVLIHLQPQDVIDILTKEFTNAERDELLFDDVLGEPYNANICYAMLIKSVADRKKKLATLQLNALALSKSELWAIPILNWFQRPMLNARTSQ